MLARKDVVLIVGFLALGALSYLILGNYFIAIGCVVGIAGVGVLGIVRGRAKS